MSNSKPDPAYYTPKEAAEILRIDRRNIYELLRSGKLKAVQFGKSWRIPKKSLYPEN